MEAVKKAFSLANATTVEATAAGYENKDVIAKVIFDENGAIIDVSFDTSSQTPGIGSKISEPEFTSQFIGFASANEVAVDVVANATITTDAAVEAVKAAFNNK